MRKVAIFVEGLTERLLVSRVIRHAAFGLNVDIVAQKAFGGRRFERIFYAIEGQRVAGEEYAPDFHILVVDSGSDNQVISDIREQVPSLASAGYERVIGLRDLRPIPAKDLKKLRDGLATSLVNLQLPVEVVVSIVETETWLLGEYSHFHRISSALTVDRIAADTGLDLRDAALEEITGAAETLGQIYALEGILYDKSEAIVTKVVDVLDMVRFSVGVSMRLESLGRLHRLVEEFLAK